MKKIGIQLNEDYDLKVQVRRDARGVIVYGLQVGDVTYQNQALILSAQKGEIKASPLTGIGINDICNDNDFSLWKREITEQLERDGQRINKLEISEKGLTLKANYT
jgi:hypothetical protein